MTRRSVVGGTHCRLTRSWWAAELTGGLSRSGALWGGGPPGCWSLLGVHGGEGEQWMGKHWGVVPSAGGCTGMKTLGRGPLGQGGAALSFVPCSSLRVRIHRRQPWLCHSHWLGGQGRRKRLGRRLDPGHSVWLLFPGGAAGGGVGRWPTPPSPPLPPPAPRSCLRMSCSRGAASARAPRSRSGGSSFHLGAKTLYMFRI